MIYIITVEFAYFLDGLGYLCWGFELIIRIIINIIENTYFKKKFSYMA